MVARSPKKSAAISPITAEVSAYIAAAPRRALPEEVVEKGKHHILDTLAAMVSGSRLAAGKKAASYVRVVGGTREACVAGTRLVTSAVNAALANGMSAHADETDDVHADSNTHPGCGIVPAALAMAERENSNGRTLLRAVVLGYDICCRIPHTFHADPSLFRKAGHVNQSFGGIFGAAAAAAAAGRLNARQVRNLLSYTAQQASGVRSFMRDEEHVLKAFLFGGMTAHNGVAGALMVMCGFSGVEDEFGGELNRNLFSAYSPTPAPEALTRELGTRFEVMNTNIKRWTVGGPIVAALDALFVLMREHQVREADVDRLAIHSPAHELPIVDDSKMAGVGMQHLMAVALVDGRVSFDSVHDASRVKDKKVLSLKQRIALVPSEELAVARPPRQCILEITMRDGRTLRHHTYAARGSAANPMTRGEVAEKAVDLMAPVIGKRRSTTLASMIWKLEQVENMRALRPLLTA